MVKKNHRVDHVNNGKRQITRVRESTDLEKGLWGGGGGRGDDKMVVKGYRSVLRDSPNDILAGLMLAIIVVLELPPKLSFNNLKEK